MLKALFKRNGRTRLVRTRSLIEKRAQLYSRPGRLESLDRAVVVSMMSPGQLVRLDTPSRPWAKKEDIWSANAVGG